MVQRMILMNFMGRQKVRRVSELKQSRRMKISLSQSLSDGESKADKSYGISTSENAGSDPN